MWFSDKGSPALGRVVHIDPTVARPVVLHRYRQKNASGTLLISQFEEIPKDGAGDPALTHITLYQIRLTIRSLTKQGSTTLNVSLEIVNTREEGVILFGYLLDFTQQYRLPEIPHSVIRVLTQDGLDGIPVSWRRTIERRTTYSS